MGMLIDRVRCMGSRSVRDYRWFPVPKASWGRRLLLLHALSRDNPAPNTWLRWCACRLPITGRYGMAPGDVTKGSTACGKTTTARPREGGEVAYDVGVFVKQK